MTDDAMHPPIKVGFVLLSPSRAPIPSTRIAVLNMFPLLREAGFAPHIVFEPEQGSQTPNVDGLLPELVAQRYDVIVFQKVHGASVEALAHGLREAGIKTVFALCDVVDVPMAQATDMTVIVTDYLKSLYPAALQHKIRVVHDGIEHPEVIKQDWGSHRGSAAAPLRAVLVTSAEMLRLPVLPALPPWLEVTIVGRYAAAPPAPAPAALPVQPPHPLRALASRARLRCHARGRYRHHPDRAHARACTRNACARLESEVGKPAYHENGNRAARHRHPDSILRAGSAAGRQCLSGGNPGRLAGLSEILARSRRAGRDGPGGTRVRLAPIFHAGTSPTPQYGVEGIGGKIASRFERG